MTHGSYPGIYVYGNMLSVGRGPTYGRIQCVEGLLTADGKNATLYQSVVPWKKWPGLINSLTTFHVLTF